MSQFKSLVLGISCGVIALLTVGAQHNLTASEKQETPPVTNPAVAPTPETIEKFRKSWPVAAMHFMEQELNGFKDEDIAKKIVDLALSDPAPGPYNPSRLGQYRKIWKIFWDETNDLDKYRNLFSIAYFYNDQIHSILLSAAKNIFLRQSRETLASIQTKNDFREKVEPAFKKEVAALLPQEVEKNVGRLFEKWGEYLETTKDDEVLEKAIRAGIKIKLDPRQRLNYMHQHLTPWKALVEELEKPQYKKIYAKELTGPEKRIMLKKIYFSLSEEKLISLSNANKSDRSKELSKLIIPALEDHAHNSVK